MPLLPSPALIVLDDAYEIPNLAPGKGYLLTLKGNFIGGSVVLEFWNDAFGYFESVDGGSWTSPAEARLVAPSRTAQLVFSNMEFSTGIAVTFIPII